MNYAVGIPTRDRPEMLARVYDAFADQTVPPAAVFVINNNSGPPPAAHYEALANAYDVPGPEQGHQTALSIMMRMGIGVGVRWDDDLIPERDCMEHLLRHFDHGFEGAVGGCYPRPGNQPVWAVGGCYPRPGNQPVWHGGPMSGTPPPDGHPGHAQFFRWHAPTNPAPKAVPARHLYSGMMYSVAAAVKAGGFCTEYSQIGYRAETDFTLRIGNCLIDPAAIAIHHLSDGGIRSVPSKEYEAMAKHDEALFKQRMTDLDIDITGGYWI